MDPDPARYGRITISNTGNGIHINKVSPILIGGYLDEEAGEEGGPLSWLMFDPSHDGQEDGLLVHHVQLVPSLTSYILTSSF